MKDLFKYLFSVMLKILLLPIRIFPIKRNRILFISVEGGGNSEYDCNPKYLYEGLAERHRDLEYIWLVTSTSPYQFLADAGVRLIQHKTFKSFYYGLTSKIVVTNGGYVSWFPFRKKQYVINTWHGGGAYKKLDIDRENVSWFVKRRYKKTVKNIRLFISSSRKFTEYVIRGAFGYLGEVLEVGMIRNDIFFKENTEIYKQKVKHKYGISDEKKIVLFTPTFREYMAEYERIDIEKLIQILEERFGGTWVFCYKAHKKSSNIFIENGKEHMINVSDYEDVQELLCAADYLITDYSSIIWDYSLTGKPITLYVPDLEQYISNNGFYVDLKDWKIPYFVRQEQLFEYIRGFSEVENKESIKRHHALLGNCETGKACDQTMEKIEKVIDGEMP